MLDTPLNAQVSPPSDSKTGDSKTGDAKPCDADSQGTATSNPETVSRFDPITGSRTLFAPHRQQRPDQFQSASEVEPDSASSCPFCLGREATTPAPVWVGKTLEKYDGRQSLATMDCIDDAKSLAESPLDDWSVRVVPNKFPAIGATPANPTRKSGSRSRQSPLFAQQVIHGGHEVIIESPGHCNSLVQLDTANVALVFAAYRDRLRYWRSAGDIQYISVFKNSGGEAGASLAHSHSQLIATSVMPNHVQSLVNRMKQHRAKTGCCLQCDLLRGELKEEKRIIAKTDSLVAYCPFASQFPMMVRITTTNHQDQFEQLSDATIESVARMLKRVAAWIEQLKPGVSYNYLLHTNPPGISDCSDSFHWSLEVFPRLTRIAGFELSSNCMINPVMPETAAAEFRRCAAAENPRVIL